jgi:tripartite-type tricarboxylate transporter receptor subunit TctC
VRTIVCALAALLGSAALHAQDWPRRQPLRVVVAFAPGSSTDLLARFLAHKLGESLGQSVEVENRAGSGGIHGARRVMAASPDGYTMLATSVAFAVSASLYENPGYDPLRDFAPVALVASTPNVIAVHPSVPAKSLAELMQMARVQPLAYASSGIGTTTHLSVERLKTANKVGIAHVPSQPAQAVLAAVDGQVQISSTSLPPALAPILAGRLRAIAVTSAQRSPALPEVPTVAESGYAGFDDLTWFGILVLRGTPASVVARLNAEINRALESADATDRLGKLGLDLRRGTPEEFAAYLRAEVPKWAKAIRDSGARRE